MQNISERWSGTASGSVHLTTEGVGRVELLQNLTGQGKVVLRNIEFRGWDVGAMVAESAVRAGSTSWSSGSGAFALQHRTVQLESVRLNGDKEATLVRGTIDFARQVDLSIATADSPRFASRGPLAGRTFRVSGFLDAPTVKFEGTTASDSASTAAP